MNPVSRKQPNPLRQWRDATFLIVMGGISTSFILLIVLLIAADLLFISPSEFKAAFSKPEIQSSFNLTILTCTLAAILSVWVATPLAYLLSRFQFPGKSWIDTLVDIPIVLPPLVLGLSLLILFHQPFPLVGHLSVDPNTGEPFKLENWFRDSLGFPISFRWPAVVIAQFAVACAFAVRTMRVTFDQISPRCEDVARTLGCTRGQAFFKIALPQAWKGIIAAFTVSWARSLGEFGPILVFAGTTRFKTEVLSSSVFLELSVGELDAAVAVSLLMVGMALAILLALRWIGASLST